MKHKRLIVFGAVTILATFGASYYVLYLKQQSAALLASREVSESAHRYARIQEAIKQPEAPSNSEGLYPDWAPLNPKDDAESAEILQPLQEAMAVYIQLHDLLANDKEWDALWTMLYSRTVSDWTMAEWEQLNAFMNGHRDLLADIRAMAAAEGPLYPLDLSEGWETLLPHLAPTREMARLLHAEALALSHAGDYVGAAADIRAGLQLAARLQGEPLLISQLVSVAIDNYMMEGVTGAYREGEIPPELAAVIARHFHTYSISESIAQSMNTEAGISLDVFSHIMESGWLGSSEFNFVQGPTPLGSWTGRVYTSPLARPWQFLDMQAYAHIMSEFEPTLDPPYYEAQTTIEQLQREIDKLPATRVITRNMLPSLINIHSAIAQAEAQRQIFLLGTAVESYANQHGNYPARLEEVRGLANGASTIDPFTGAPYHYNTSGNGFELYSVGRDLADDGGRNDLRDGDIVWRGETAPKTTGVKMAGLK